MKLHFFKSGLLSRAAILTLVYVLCSLAGLRQYTGFLSGTIEAPVEQARLPITLGLIYILSYLSFTVLVPILFLAAGILGMVKKTQETQK